MSLPAIDTASAVAQSGAPAVAAAKSSTAPALDIGQLLGDTLQKLIVERRGGAGTLADKHGKIGLEEFSDAVVPLGLAPAEVSLIFSHFDKEGTGFIDFEELHSELTARVAERSSGGAAARKGGGRYENTGEQLVFLPK